ncbi:MAG: NUDIX hydrolase [Candidatus Omnitrophota bacterium]
MKIKEATIMVTRRPVASARAAVVVAAVPRERETSVRAYYNRALRKAAKEKRASIAFCIDDTGRDDALLLPATKILAQEIFRLLHEDRHSLAKIFVCVNGPRAYAACKKNVLGYLNYIEYKLKSPFLTVDTIIEFKGGIVLIKRSNPPFGWAIPGGFVDYGESLEDAAAREAKEETNLDVTGLKQLHTYSDPRRDPRFHTVCTVFSAKGKGPLRAGDDAADIRLIDPRDLKNIEFAFNHRDVIKDYLKIKEGKNVF